MLSVSGLSNSTLSQQPKPSKASLRRQLRQRRRDLTPLQQRHAAQQFAKLIACQPFFKSSKKLGLYLATDGELDLGYLLDVAVAQGKSVFLPVIPKNGRQRLMFLPMAGAGLRPNRYGILEPSLKGSHAIPEWQLDLVLVPLVGFDRHGGRLGMGGGFYDRCFAELDRRPRRPLLIGVGHSCQEVEALPTDTWDLNMNAIVSDREVIKVDKCRRHKFRP